MPDQMKLGDFSKLAKHYSASRPDYCPFVLHALLGYLAAPPSSIDCIDIGAGTGIWSRMVYDAGVEKLKAVEPNKEMRQAGSDGNNGRKIEWVAGMAEKTGLANHSIDWITMASSFHWADYNKAIQEFHRVLRPGGVLTLLWNPRLIEKSCLLLKIEHFIHELKPDLVRRSSGLSNFTETLSNDLRSTGIFGDIIYVEGQHTIKMDKERYLTIWKSVSDVQSQLGKRKFCDLINYIDEIVDDDMEISANYLTRAWSCRAY